MNITTDNLLYHIILAIPIFLIAVWLTGKFIKIKQYKFITSGILTVLMTPIAYLGVVHLFFFIFFGEPTKKFDTKVWQTETNKRFQMADNIIDSKLLIEKDTNQIKQLLGEPTERDSLTNWTYNMGQGGGGLGFLFHSLIVSFENEKVTRVVHAKIQD